MASKFSFCLKTGLLCSLLFISTHHPVSADVMGNSQFQLDTTQPNPVSPSTINKQNENNNIVIKDRNISNNSSFITSTGSLRLSVSTPDINYGDILPGEPILRTLHLTIKASDTPYTLLLAEDQALSGSKGTIPDTTCDNGSCTSVIPAAWQSPLTFGFGYRCSDNDNACNSDFIDQNMYKQIPKGSESGKTVLSSNSPASEADLIFKVNISGSQPHDLYHNTINLILLPRI